MRQVKLREIAKEKKTVEIFRGYDHRPVIDAGSWYEAKNLTTDRYPLLCVRKNRSKVDLYGEVHDGGPAPGNRKIMSFTGKDALVLLDWDGVLWSNGYRLPLLGGEAHVDIANVRGTFSAVISSVVTLKQVLQSNAPAVYPYTWDATNQRWRWDLQGCMPGHYTFTYDADDNKWHIGENGYAIGNLGISVTGAVEDRNEITVQLHNTLTLPGDGPSMVSMGAYVVFWPWKIYVNAAKLAAGETLVLHTDYGSLEQHYSLVADDEGGTAPDDLKRYKLTLCDSFGNAYTDVVVGAEVPQDETKSWMDTSQEIPSLRQYSASSSSWAAIPTVYVKIEASGIGSGLQAGDGVSISAKLPKYYWPMSDRGKFTKEFLNSSHVLVDVGTDYIVVVGIFVPGTQAEQAEAMTGVTGWSYESGAETILLKTDAMSMEHPYLNVDRNVPEMDFVVECGNRLWGCFYGKKDGAVVNEIYASKLGDFKNWNVFQGLSTDSYAASRGADGPFSGAAVLDGHPLFFREGCVEKVFPSSAGAHQIQTHTLDGIQKGSWRSAVVIDDRLYYKGVGGVYVYTGTLPRLISSAFGNAMYTEASAGRHGKKYYVVMKDAAGAWTMFCYDTKCRLWQKEDAPNEKPGEIVTWRDAAHFLKDGDIWRVDGGADSRGVAWYAESGVLGLDLPTRKYISRINLRYERELGAGVRVYVMYDESGRWICKEELDETRLYAGTISFWPRRCDTFRLRLEGVGGFTLYSISYERERGSDER